MTAERRSRLALVLMIVGSALRTWQFAGRGSLWLDEAAVARNILARDYAQLFEPLDNAQIAPRGFLLASKLAVSLFGPTEHALRLYSFLLSLLALPLFYRLARSLLAERAALFALALFALLGRLVYYASEAKQYGGDVFFAVLLLLLAAPLVRGDRDVRRAIALAVAAAIAVWFSQPAVFIVAGIAVSIGLSALARRATPDRSFLALLAWLAMTTVSAVPALHFTQRALRPDDAAYMRSFWAGGFLPWPVHASLAYFGDVLAWPFARIYGLFYDLLGMPLALGGVAVALLGAIAFWRRDRADLWMLIAPIGIALLAGALHLFPFAATLDGFNKLAAGNARLLLFLVPSLLLLVAAGIAALLDAPSRVTRYAGVALAVFTLGAPLFYDLTEIPHTPHDLRPLIAASRQRRPGDRMYVYYGGRQAFELYRGRFAFPDSSVIRGGCHRPAWREYLRELDAQRGSGRLWVLMVRPALVNGVHEGQLIDDYLGQISPRLASWGQKDAYLALYDMRIAQLPRADRAAWHPAPRHLPGDTVPLGFSCAGVFPSTNESPSLTDRINPQLR